MLLLWLAGRGAAQGFTVSSIYDSSMVQLINQNYRGAKTILEKHLASNPDDLKARYLLFSIEQTRILDYESYLVEQKQFQGMADTLKTFFERRIATLSGSDSTTCLFYLANVYGGKSVMQAKTGNWFDGVKNAITSVTMLREVKARDTGFFAADLGTGIFNYYLSTSFKWLPFVENKEEEGLAAIESAIKAEFPYNYAAKNSLCWILIERKNFQRADSIARSVLSEIPDNTIFLRISALIALWTGRYADALRSGNRLAALTDKRVPVNWSDLVAAHTVLVQGNYELGKKNEACNAADRILSRKIPAGYMEIPHIKKNMKYIASIRQKCRKGAW
jgi:hypothetical protein